MKGKIWIRIGLSLATIFCLLSLVPAAYLEILNLIQRETSFNHTLFHAFWATSCLVGPLLAWITHVKKSRSWPWIFIGVPTVISVYEIVTHFLD